MNKIAHISDLHFGKTNPEVVERLVAKLCELEADILVVSGDLTQRARSSQFKEARALLDRLPHPQLIVPGNHDVPLYNLPMRLMNPYANHIAAFGDNLEPVCRHADCLIIGLKTTRRYRHKHGEISDRQIERVRELLIAAEPDQLRLVVAHHPFYVERKQDRKDLLRGGLPALREWSRAGADLILGGHIHFPYISPLHRRIEEIIQPTWVVQAGTAVSRRIRWNAGNSVNMIHYRPTTEDRACTVERYEYDGRERRFIRAENQALELRSSP